MLTPEALGRGPSQTRWAQPLMPPRTVIKSVLRGFLGTFTSRYPDLGGYWLFGYVVESLESLSVDLLDSPDALDEEEPLAYLRALAVTRFREQLAKSGLSRSTVSSAALVITRGAPANCGAYGVPLPLRGWQLTFTVGVRMDNGRVFEDSETVCVAPQRLMASFR